MTSFIDQLIAFVSANAWLAYLTLFLAALLEAVPVVGSVIPGSTIILALSALVPGGELKLTWVLAAAIAGALLGDGSAFWAGHRSQREILNTWPLANYPRLVAQVASCQRGHRHGGCPGGLLLGVDARAGRVSRPGGAAPARGRARPLALDTLVPLRVG